MTKAPTPAYLAAQRSEHDHPTDQHGVDMRTDAYAHALNRIGQAIEAGGTQSYFKGGH